MQLTLIAGGVPGPQIQDGRREHHDHQGDVISKLDEEWRRTGLIGRPFRACFRLPTGGGKTRVATHWAVGRWKAARPPAILWLAHRKELLQQAADAFDEALRSSPIGTYGQVRMMGLTSSDAMPRVRSDWSPAMGPFKEIAICSVPACTHPEPRDRLLTWARDQAELLVIIDEAHHALASSYVRLLEELGVQPTKVAAARPSRHLLGLSATPIRTDRAEQRPLERLFNDRIISGASLDELVERRFLAKPHVLPMEAIVSLQEIVGGNAAEERYRVRWHDLHPQSRRRLARKVSPIAVERYSELTRNGHRGLTPPKKAIVFCVDTAHAGEIAEQFNDKGHWAAPVHSKSPGRADALKRFQWPASEAGYLDVLTTVDLLTEGVDLPCTEIVVMLRPTMSRILFQQMVGRCLRGPAVPGGKANAYVLDLALNTHEFPNWMTADALLGEYETPFTNRRARARRPAADEAQPDAQDEPDEHDLEADVASWLIEFLDMSIDGRTLAGWYEIPEPDDEDRHSLLAVFDDDRQRYQVWASALLRSPDAPDPDVPDGSRFRVAVLTLGAEPPFHAVECVSLSARIAELAAGQVAFGGPGLLRDRLREAVMDMRRRFGLVGDGGADCWRAALRVLDRRMTDDFLKAVRR